MWTPRLILRLSNVELENKIIFNETKKVYIIHRILYQSFNYSFHVWLVQLLQRYLLSIKCCVMKLADLWIDCVIRWKDRFLWDLYYSELE
jgi:hypothetical protein